MNYQELWPATSLALVACSPDLDDRANPDPERADDFSALELDSEAITEPPAPFAVLEPADGYKIVFVELRGSSGHRGVGVAEEMPGGTPSIIDQVLPHAANPLVVFRALSDEDEAIPEVLTELYGTASLPSDFQRGEAIVTAKQALSVSMNRTDVACSDTWFINWVNDSLPYDTWRLNNNGTESNWGWYCDYSIPTTNCGSCSNATRKRYDHIVYNVDEWRAYSCLNSGGNHFYNCLNGTLPLRVYYMYRDANNNGWYTAYASPRHKERRKFHAVRHLTSIRAGGTPYILATSVGHLRPRRHQEPNSASRAGLRSCPADAAVIFFKSPLNGGRSPRH